MKVQRNSSTKINLQNVFSKRAATISPKQCVNSLRPSDAYMRQYTNLLWFRYLTNAGILLIGTLGTNFSEILIGIQTFSFEEMHFKMLSAKWRPCVSASMLLTNTYGTGYNMCNISLHAQNFEYRFQNWWNANYRKACMKCTKTTYIMKYVHNFDA